MLQNKRQNFHHSKMPDIGEIVTIPNMSHLTCSGQKAIVVSFNLCDNADRRYSYGIHLVNVEMLKDRDIKYTIAGHWFMND